MGQTLRKYCLSVRRLRPRVRTVQMERGLIVRCLCAGCFGFVLGLVVLNGGNGKLEVQEPTTNMAAFHQPAMMQPMQAARPRNFMQPLRATKSPIAGFLDITVPFRSKEGKPEELEIIRPITEREEMTMNRREMMSMAAAATAAAMPVAAQAGEEISESLRKKIKKKICAANPTA